MQKNLKKLRLVFSRVRRRALSKHLNLVRVLLILLIALFVFGGSQIFMNTLAGTQVENALLSVNNFMFTPSGVVETHEGRTNLLILGKVGEESDSPELTDTIIIASFSHEKNKVNLVSIPRDIWSPEINLKINEAYKVGNEQKSGGGLVLSKSLVGKIVGVPIHYAVVFDLTSLKEIINIIEGVDIEVERSFTDEKYPVAGRELDECDGDLEYKCRYEVLKFEKGLQTMDGETALKFARSRQSVDLEEGTDFARSKRQQLVITALIKKIFSLNTLISPGKLTSLYSVAQNRTETDILNSQAAILARRFAQGRENIERKVIPEDLLINPPLIKEYEYLYVFLPKNESWKEVHKWFEDILD